MTWMRSPASGGCDAGTARAELPRWFAGCWRGTRGGEQFTERWIVADDATMIGMSHTVKGGRLSAFEFLRVVLKGGAAVYIAQPGGAPPTEFTAPPPSRRRRRSCSRNPQHDFPKRVGYRRWTQRISPPGSTAAPPADRASSTR